MMMNEKERLPDPVEGTLNDRGKVGVLIPKTCYEQITRLADATDSDFNTTLMNTILLARFLFQAENHDLAAELRRRASKGTRRKHHEH